jgi:hypothetical protein
MLRSQDYVRSFSYETKGSWSGFGPWQSETFPGDGLSKDSYRSRSGWEADRQLPVQSKLERPLDLRRGLASLCAISRCPLVVQHPNALSTSP